MAGTGIEETSTIEPRPTPTQRPSWTREPEFLEDPKSLIGKPRLSLLGGYVIKYKTAQEWAGRLRGEKLEDMEPLIAGAATQVINCEIEPMGVHIRFVGEDIFNNCMIATQRKPFRGYVGMPSEEIPKFVEGEHETLARKVLIEQGVSEEDFKFETFLD